MGPGASTHGLSPEGRRDRARTIWAAVVVILVAAIAAASFAVDQTMTLSSREMSLPLHDSSR